MRRFGLFCALSLLAAEVQGLSETPLQVTEGTAKKVGHEDSSLELHLAIGLRPPHLAEEEEFISHPGNHLTAEEWDARFAPSVEDEAAVVRWLESQGLSVTKRFPNRLIIDVTGTTGAVEKAFHVQINRYNLEGDSEDYYSNDSDPVIPPELASIIQSVMGLNNIQRLQSNPH